MGEPVGTSLIQVVSSVSPSLSSLHAGDELASGTDYWQWCRSRILLVLSKNQTVFGRVQEPHDLNPERRAIRVVKLQKLLNEDLVTVNMQTISAIRNTFPLIAEY